MMRYLFFLVVASALQCTLASEIVARENRARAIAQALESWSREAIGLELNGKTQGIIEKFRKQDRDEVADLDKTSKKVKSELVGIGYKIETETQSGSLAIYICKTQAEAARWYKSFLKGFNVQPPLAVENLGDEAARFPESDPSVTGSLFFRRGICVVQVNTRNTVISLGLAKVIEASIIETEALDARRSDGEASR